MKNEWLQNGVRKVAGVLLILFGIVGLFVPVLQGVAMIIAGIYLLGNKKLIAWFQRLMKRFKKKS